MNFLPESLHYGLKQVQALALRAALHLKLISVTSKSGFDLDNVCNKIGSEELRDIVWYNIVGHNKHKFFIIGNSTLSQVKPYHIDDIQLLKTADWYMLVDPHKTSHLILPQEQLDIGFNGKGKILSHKCKDGDPWTEGGGTFQIDKFSASNPIIPTDISTRKVLEILTQRFRIDF